MNQLPNPSLVSTGLRIPKGPDISTALTGGLFSDAPAREEGINVSAGGGEVVHSAKTPPPSRVEVRHNWPSPGNTIEKNEGIASDYLITNPTDPPASEATEDENDHTIYSKARFERRLRDRWRCKVKGHSCCFKDGESAHIQLTEDHLKQWANICNNGFATILVPPESIIPSSSRHDLDTESIRSSSSNNTIKYQRPFRFQLNPSLTDIRSWRGSLSSGGGSSLSSGEPGPGYLSGKAIKWVGEKVLDAATPLVIRRRLWAIERLIKYMKQASLGDLQNLILTQEKSLHRLLDDLLELSSGDYNAKYRNTSRKLGPDFIYYLMPLTTNVWQNKALEAIFWLLRVKVVPLCYFDHDCGSVNLFAVALCEILLQESLSHDEMDCTISELVMCTCNELSHGVTGTSARSAFHFNCFLHKIPAGRKELSKLGQSGGLLEHVAMKAFKKGTVDYAGHASAVLFFADFAGDHPEYRRHVLGPNGLSLVISRLQELIPVGKPTQTSPIDWQMMYWLAEPLTQAAHFVWAVPTLLALNSCNVLLQLLVVHHQLGRQDEWIDYKVIFILCKLVVMGEPGRHAVHDALSGLTPENANILRRLHEESWKRDWMAIQARPWISEILEMHLDSYVP